MYTQEGFRDWKLALTGERLIIDEDRNGEQSEDRELDRSAPGEPRGPELDLEPELQAIA